MILDGGMGTMIQSYHLEEEDFRGKCSILMWDHFVRYKNFRSLCNASCLTQVSQLVCQWFVRYLEYYNFLYGYI